MEIQTAHELSARVVAQLRRVIVGQDGVLMQMTVALIAGGHALLEGVPGTAKTLAVRALAMVTGTQFRRIQFTPDLMPSDIIGVNIYNMATSEFVFRPGPIFADLVLGDEINRAPAKTQAALLEAMQERQATVDGEPHAMSDAFTVYATQNPVEFEGTYPLPEAELDRFMLKIVVGYPSAEHEGRILDLVHGGLDPAKLSTAGLEPVLDATRLAEVRHAVASVHVEESVRRYITEIVRQTRTRPQIALGASPRAAVMLMAAAKAMAVLNGREFVTPDEVKIMALPVLRHRIMLQPEFEVEGHTNADCVRAVLAEVKVPR